MVNDYLDMVGLKSPVCLGIAMTGALGVGRIKIHISGKIISRLCKFISRVNSTIGTLELASSYV